jgi:hypothetical protein
MQQLLRTLMYAVIAAAGPVLGRRGRPRRSLGGGHNAEP